LQKELELTGEFKDHFSTKSDAYATCRPRYPAELFQFLASTVADHAVAWDCATGNGQVAAGLAKYFPRVIASDASQSQIDAAVAHPNIEYRVATAERSGLTDQSVDLITVGQAFHWFDEQRFMLEARRLLRREGVLAIWCYKHSVVNDACDAIVDTLYRDIVGEFWQPERLIVEQGYSAVAMPGATVAVPEFTMSLKWHAADMLGYLRTWSACKYYETEMGSDPVDEISAGLTSAWGEGKRRVAWPLAIRASRPNSLLE